MFSNLQVAFFAAAQVKHTPLYDFHIRHQGNVVPFCGWALPTVYKDHNISESHLYTRSCATIFDVSHMGQLKIHGKDRYNFIESLVPGDIKGLEMNQARLTQFTNDHGGIIDDTIITKKDGYLFEIINAATTENDLKYIYSKVAEWKGKGKDVFVEHLGSQFALVALQGPKAWNFLQAFINKTNPNEEDRFDLTKQSFMTSHQMKINGMECRVSRLGYTGEDGFEIAIPADKADETVEMLLETELESKEKIMLAALGPRDTLRLEAGLCLMGDEMTSETTPIEAALAWTISKRRRQEKGFPGANRILYQLKHGVTKKRMGFIVPNSKSTPRTDMKIYADKNREELVGHVTSGSYGPSLGYACGMCYIEDPKYIKKFEKEHKKVELFADVRGRPMKIQLAKYPFVKKHTDSKGHFVANK